MHTGGTQVATAVKAPDNVRKMRRAVAAAEQSALDKARRTVKEPVVDVGTGQTIIRMQASPIARLLDRKKIGGEEVRAAEEILAVFMAISGALMFKGQSMEFRDKTSGSPSEPAHMVDAHRRYAEYRDYWSGRAKRGDKTLAIIIASVVDERSFRIVEQDFGLRHGKAEIATIWGLRDYAARAGWCGKRMAVEWKYRASTVFRIPRLDKAGQIMAAIA